MGTTASKEKDVSPTADPTDEIQPVATEVQKGASTAVGTTAAQGTKSKPPVRDLETTGANVHANPVYESESKLPTTPAPTEITPVEETTPVKKAPPSPSTAALAPATPEQVVPEAVAPTAASSPSEIKEDLETGPTDKAVVPDKIHEGEPDKVAGGGCFACFAASKKNKKEKAAAAEAAQAEEAAPEAAVETAKAPVDADVPATVGIVPAAAAGGALASKSTADDEDEPSKDVDSVIKPKEDKAIENGVAAPEGLSKEVKSTPEEVLPVESESAAVKDSSAEPESAALPTEELTQLKKETAKLAEQTEELVEETEEEAAKKAVPTAAEIADTKEEAAVAETGTAFAAPGGQEGELDAHDGPASGQLTPLTRMQSLHETVEDTVDAPTDKGFTSLEAHQAQQDPTDLNAPSVEGSEDGYPAAAAGGGLAAAATAAAASRSSETTTTTTVATSQPVAATGTAEALPVSTAPADSTTVGTAAAGTAASGTAGAAGAAGGAATGAAVGIAAGAAGAAAVVGGAAAAAASKSGKSPEEKKAAKEAKQKEKEEKKAAKAKAKEEKKQAKLKAEEEKRQAKLKAEEERRAAAAQPAGEALEGAEGEAEAEKAAAPPKRGGFFGCFGSAQPPVEYEGQEGAVVGAAAAGGVAGAAIASAESPEGKTKADVLAPGTPTQSEGELPVTPAESPAKPLKPSQIDYSAIHMAKTPSLALRTGYNPRTGLYDTDAASKPKPRLFSPMRAGHSQLQSSVDQVTQAASQRRIASRRPLQERPVNGSWKVVTTAPVGRGIEKPEVSKNLRPLSSSLA